MTRTIVQIDSGHRTADGDRIWIVEREFGAFAARAYGELADTYWTAIIYCRPGVPMSAPRAYGRYRTRRAVERILDLDTHGGIDS